MAPRKFKHPRFTTITAILFRHPDEGDGDDGGDAGDGDRDELGQAGQQALAAERKARRQAERNAREQAARLAEMEKQLETLRQQSMTDDEKRLNEHLAAREAELRQQFTAEAAQQVAKAERVALTARLESKAAKLTNPADAAVFVNLDDLERADDGSVSDATLTAAIDTLLKERPYLAAKAGAGSADQGHRRDAAPDFSDRKQLDQELARFGLRAR